MDFTVELAENNRLGNRKGACGLVTFEIDSQEVLSLEYEGMREAVRCNTSDKRIRFDINGVLPVAYQVLACRTLVRNVFWNKYWLPKEDFLRFINELKQSGIWGTTGDSLSSVCNKWDSSHPITFEDLLSEEDYEKHKEELESAPIFNDPNQLKIFA